MADAFVSHADQRTVLRLQVEPDVEKRTAVAADRSLPPSSTRPKSRSPSKVPPGTMPIRRVVVGVAPTASSLVSSLMVNSGHVQTLPEFQPAGPVAFQTWSSSPRPRNRVPAIG